MTKRSPRDSASSSYSPLERRQLLAADLATSYLIPDAQQEQVARDWLADSEIGVKLEQSNSDLELVEIQRGLASTVTRFRQTVHGLPVVNSWVTTIQGPNGEFVDVHDQSIDIRVDGLPREAALGFQAVEKLALDHSGSTRSFADSRGELAWYVSNDKTATQVWSVTVFGKSPETHTYGKDIAVDHGIHGDFVTIVDMQSGRILSQVNRIANFASGSGEIYYPNPYQQQGSGNGITDNNDANSTLLSNLRIGVTLDRLDDGTGLIRGEFVDLSSLNSGDLPDIDANEPTRVYDYTRDDARFEQVVIYHTVDQIQQWFHDLGFDDDAGTPNGIRDFPTLANAHWDNADQSFYSLGDDAIHFGDGGVDDGEDGDIIAHEYGHAIQFNQNAAWGGGEMGAMGEGFGDYLAASFFQDIGDAAFQASHAAAVGEWDATSYSNDNPPNLRRVDGNKVYPVDLVGQVHSDGEIWSRALWDLDQDIGADAAMQVILESHFLVAAGASMVDAAEAILLADQNLNSGQYQANIRAAFEARGILEPLPTIGSISLDKAAYSVGDDVVVTVEDANAPATIQVSLVSSNGDTETLSLTGSGAIYTGTISSVSGSTVSGDGQIQAANGDTFIVTYVDTDDGNGNEVTAEDTGTFADVNQYDSEDTPINITDNNSIESTITVPDSGNLLDIDLRLDVTHTWVSDLTATLTSPDGIEITLFSEIGGNGDNYTDTFFDDEATVSINNGNAPFTGNFRPDESFGSLDGISITGDWVLTITDSATQDQGTLNNWSLFIVAEPVLEAEILDRQIFYRGSSFDTGGTDSVATDKQFLLPGQTATFANYSSYAEGINGLVLDVDKFNATPTLANIDDFFEFRVGNDDTTADWTAAPTPTAVTFEENVDGSGTDRVFIEWADKAISNEWLEIRVKAGATTGLVAEDVFYFGSVIGDTGNESDRAIVDTLDIGGIRQNFSGFFTVDIDDDFDLNRDGVVDTLDIGVVRENATGFDPVNLITPDGN